MVRVVGVVASRCLGGVGPGWWCPVGDAVGDVAFPAEFVVFAVVVAAEQGAVVDAGALGEAVVGDVVGLAPGGWDGAAGE